jgi:hypothetical protein
MKFVPLVYDSSGELGARRGTLPCSVRGNQTLVDDPPKRGHCFRFGFKKVLKKSSGVQRLRIGIRLPALTSFRDPIVRFRGINNLKDARWIEIGAALIVQNTVIIGLDSNHDIRHAWCEVRIWHVFTTELDYQRDCTAFVSVVHPGGDWEWRILRTVMKDWSHPPESNRRPTDYESVALPTELGWLIREINNLALVLDGGRNRCCE